MVNVNENTFAPEKRVQIQYLRSLNKSDRFIAQTVGCTRETVARWANRPFGITEEKKRPGPKSKTTDRTKRKIVHEIINSDTSLRKLGRKYHLSPQTINTIIKRYSINDPIKPYKQQCVPRLTAAHKLLRLL